MSTLVSEDTPSYAVPDPHLVPVNDYLTTQFTIPGSRMLLQIGTPGIYNIAPDQAMFGVEIRPIPADDVAEMKAELDRYCATNQLELRLHVMENAITCNPQNPYLMCLLATVRRTSGQEPTIARKLPGTSARFAPQGQGVGSDGCGSTLQEGGTFHPQHPDLLSGDASTGGTS